MHQYSFKWFCSGYLQPVCQATHAGTRACGAKAAHHRRSSIAARRAQQGASRTRIARTAHLGSHASHEHTQAKRTGRASGVGGVGGGGASQLVSLRQVYPVSTMRRGEVTFASARLSWDCTSFTRWPSSSTICINNGRRARVTTGRPQQPRQRRRRPRQRPQRQRAHATSRSSPARRDSTFPTARCRTQGSAPGLGQGRSGPPSRWRLGLPGATHGTRGVMQAAMGAG